MMHTIESEKAKYNKIWDFKGYAERSPGLRHLPEMLKWMNPYYGSSIIDWGSGSGQAADKLHELGYDVRMVDIAENSYKGKYNLPLTVASLWDLPEGIEPSRYGICCDVMEHIPPEFVEQVIANIAKHTTEAVFFQIALFDDKTFTHAGPLHLSLFEISWWQDRLKTYFTDCTFRGTPGKHLFGVCRV